MIVFSPGPAQTSPCVGLGICRDAMRIERKIDFSNILERAIFQEELSQTKGWHNVKVGPARRMASTPQHRFYRGVLVPLAKAYLTESQGEELDESSTHWFLKTTLRPIPVVNKDGEEIGVTAKSHGLYELPEMMEFIDDVVKLLTDCGVKVPPPDKDYRMAG